MSTTTIYFIRHGEVYNPKNVFYGRAIDAPLTQRGKEKLRKIALQIKVAETRIDCIYTSPLARAVDSARFFADVLNNPAIVVENDIIEVDIPALIGHSLAERNIIHASGTDEYGDEFVKRGNESRDAIVKRMQKAVNNILKKETGKIVLFISHGDPLRFLFFTLENPGTPTPPVGSFIKEYSPKMGEGWKIVFSTDGAILAKEFITLENT